MSDYLALFDSKDVHDRADAGRQLAKVGTPLHLPRLLQHAFEDKSPGVRLYAIGAAADILSRYRVGERASVLSAADRKAILTSFGSLDPAVNAGMFSVLANLGLKKQARRIVVGLQDPRLDVRTGACVGIYRYCISAEGHADDDMRERVLKLMRGRLRPDAGGALARLCAECGWQDSRDTLEGLLDRDDQVAEAAQLALERLDAMEQQDFLAGIWMSWSADAGERSPSAEPNAWMLLSEGFGLEVGPDEVRAFDWSTSTSAVEGDTPRRMFPPNPGDHERRPGFQIGNRAWYAAEDKDVAKLAALFLDHAGALENSRRTQAANALVALLPKNIGGKKLSARVELAAGNAAVARARLEDLTNAKKGGAEALFWLGEACHADGDEAAARKAWTAYLAKATRNDPNRAAAGARLA
jgi:hypothetical protein